MASSAGQDHTVDDGEDRAPGTLVPLDTVLPSLPVLDGWEAIRQLKADPKTAAIPVIALTAHALAEDERTARASGADDFDTKPVDLARILLKVEALLQKTG